MERKLSYEELERKIGEMEQSYAELRNVKEAIQEAYEEYRQLLNGIGDAYGEADLHKRLVLVNRSFCELFGYPEDVRPEQINHLDHMSSAELKEIVMAYNDVFRTGRPLKGYVHKIIRKDGHERIIEHCATLKKNIHDVPVGFRAILRDITELRQAKSELSRQRSHLKGIFESIKDALVIVDGDAVVLEVNRAARNICGFSDSDSVGRMYFDVPKPCEMHCHGPLMEVVREQKEISSLKIECRHARRPQQVVNVSAVSLSGQEGEPVGAVLVMRDITRLVNLENEVLERQQYHHLVGKSRKMQDVYRLLEYLSDVETTVLITGETGTGKELVARALHYGGPRASKPLVTVNSSALAETLLESELFGHVKGAFTGAVKDKEGRFQAADGGTILLDEIGDISPRIQLKLLRVLQEKECERVGETTPVKLDVRVIAATNKDLPAMIRRGEFREDLYYRLKVMEINLPPLRERRDDIPLLVEHYCETFNRTFSKKIKGVSDEVMKLFMTYRWPGNVRELGHVIERAYVLCRDKKIGLDHIPAEVKDGTSQKPGALIDNGVDTESPYIGPESIEEALKRSHGNKSKAARLLGVHRATIYRKMSKYNLGKVKP